MKNIIPIIGLLLRINPDAFKPVAPPVSANPVVQTNPANTQPGGNQAPVSNPQATPPKKPLMDPKPGPKPGPEQIKALFGPDVWE